MDSLTQLSYFALCEAAFIVVPKGHEIVIFVCVQNIFGGKRLCYLISGDRFWNFLFTFDYIYDQKKT